MNAVGACGLQLYNFGQTVSLVFFTDTWKPDSFYDRVKENADLGMHTLLLLDIKVKEQSEENLARYVTPICLLIYALTRCVTQWPEDLRAPTIHVDNAGRRAAQRYRRKTTARHPRAGKDSRDRHVPRRWWRRARAHRLGHTRRAARATPRGVRRAIAQSSDCREAAASSRGRVRAELRGECGVMEEGCEGHIWVCAGVMGGRPVSMRVFVHCRQHKSELA